ncbi:midnolin-like [Mugil cephalus]|uniref:midnolin-like n=1 Tax=Mugil cephalus TaxID=48193 RepID=UPI001FB72294|nr:midnolin-like [Mugil cephalus]
MEQRQQQRGLCSLFAPSQSAGCGAGVPTGQPSMRLFITSTTGSPVELTVPRGETLEGLRTRISQKLGLQKHRIVLLHKHRHLTAGKLLDLGVTDGSKLTLVPAIEAGLVCSTTRAERTAMDVLESLTEVQINDFLSGRSPLTINLGNGAQMMYVQLQLSAQDVKELQQERDSRAPSCGGRQTGLLSHAASASASARQSNSISQTSSQAPESTPSVQCSSQKPRTPFNSAAHISHSSAGPPVNCHHPSSLPHSHSASPLSAPSLPSGCPPPSSPLEAATPVCSSGPTGSTSGPPSPTPASTFTESNINPSSTAEVRKPPGAVIESLVSHSPGVFSGTFSGTLAPCSQSGITHPRRGIAIILQILNDLLSAACHHQRAPAAPPLPHCSASDVLPVNTLLTAQESCKVRRRPPVIQRTEQLSKAPGDDGHQPHTSTEENQTLQNKLERLQFLLHQRRLRRRTRTNSPQTSHPYQHRHHRP